MAVTFAPIVIMGVSGSGKTTIGVLLAAKLHVAFIDADELHSPANKKKMAAGRALSDEDRLPWLESVAEVLARGPGVVACSALQRHYRDILRRAAPGARFVYLDGSKETLLKRVSARSHAFMPASMLDSQIQTLEPPQPHENVLSLSIEAEPAKMVDSVVRWLLK